MRDIDESPFRDEIRNLLRQKGHSQEPTYEELIEIIKDRYGEEYSYSQLRTYKTEVMDADEMMPPKKAREEIEKRRETIDVAARRQDLLEIQRNRREKAMETEEQMSGMILEQASDMIKLENRLLDALSEDYERLGILQSTSEINIEMSQVQSDPFAELLSESLSDNLSEEEREELEEERQEHADYVDDLSEVVEADDTETRETQEPTPDTEAERLDKDPDNIDIDDITDE